MGRRHCDPWWEPETDWHRAWKSRFPLEWREVIHTDDETGEKHVADMKTDRGFVWEFQHSPISLQELQSREKFYRRMLWIVDGQGFRDRFIVHEPPLPDPAAPITSDLRFGAKGNAFWRPSERDPDSSLVQIHSSREIDHEIRAAYRGHHLFEWKRAHQAWMQAQAPVFFAFGDDELLWLQIYDPDGTRCVRRVSAGALVSKHGGC